MYGMFYWLCSFSSASLEKIRSDYVSVKVVLQRFELFAGPV
jgi:hypothetical protein